MTCEENLIEATVSLIDAKYHVNAAQVRGEIEGKYTPPTSVRRDIMNALVTLENVIDAWRKEIEVAS